MDEPATTDPDLFELVHRLMHSEEPDRRAERREGARHPYHCLQLMAPYLPPKQPNAAAFRQIPCDDLSTSGMSFFLSEPPAYQQVVIALGDVPFTFLVAEIVQTQPVGRGDEQVYRVGCRFLGRLK